MGKIAFLFSGQGAQYAGMGRELFNSSPAAKKVFEMADSIRPGTSEQCFFGDEAALALTINTQPCLFTVDLACARAANEAGIRAEGVAGFSLGEVAAAAFAGIMNDEQAFKLVCRRAELMQSASERFPGGMSAVLKLSGDKVSELASHFKGLYPVNYNLPEQTVVSGSISQLAEFEEEVKRSGGRAIRLKVGGCFHSPAMASASEGLAQYLSGAELNEPSIPLYANSTAGVYTRADAARLLSEQVSSPVLWYKTIDNMRESGFDCFVECGAGKKLTDLITRMEGSVRAFRAETPALIAEAAGAAVV